MLGRQPYTTRTWHACAVEAHLLSAIGDLSLSAFLCTNIRMVPACADGARWPACLQLVRDDVEAAVRIGEHTLGPPKYFRGEAYRVLPLMQVEPAQKDRAPAGDR